MDLKFLSLLVLIILITLYFINEFKMLKSHITINNDNVNKLIKGKFHGFLSEVKELNTDLVNQTRKINKIHSQKITNMSNYFTESENDGNNIMNYLSDAKETDKMFKVEHNESANKSVTKSNKSKKSKNNDDDIISNSSSPNNVSKINNKELSETSTSTDTESNKQDEVNQHIENIINLSGRLSASQQDDNVQDDEVSVNSKQSDKSHKSHKSIRSEGSRKSNGSNKSGKSNESKESRKSQVHVYDNSYRQSEHSRTEHGSVELDQPRSDEIKIESVKFTKLNSEPEDTISIESTKLKSLHDMISFGSKKSKGNKQTLQIGTLQYGKSNKKDINSMDSNDIKNLSTLDVIDKYSKKNLDNIGRVLNLDNYYKEGTKRILYKKEELYLKIKEELNKKSNQ